MPKRFRSRSRRGFKKFYGKKKQFRRFARKVMRVVRPEGKYIDTAFLHNTGLTATVTHLTAVPAGDTASERSGRKITLRSLLLRMSAQIDTDNVFGDYVRVILFQDKQQVGDTTPAASDVLQTVNPISPLNGNSGNRFKVLKDYYFPLSGGAIGAGDANVSANGIKTFKFFKKFNNPTMLQFNGDAGTDIQKNGLYMLCVCAFNTVDGYSTVSGSIRVRYIDN